jgi:hypothetical protein
VQTIRAPIPALPKSDRLEVEFKSQLQLTSKIKCGRDDAKIAVAHGGIWSVKVRMVESVKGLRAKLQAHSFMDLRESKVLEQRHRDISCSRLPHARDRPRSAAERVWRD